MKKNGHPPEPTKELDGPASGDSKWTVSITKDGVERKTEVTAHTWFDARSLAALDLKCSAEHLDPKRLP